MGKVLNFDHDRDFMFKNFNYLLIIFVLVGCVGKISVTPKAKDNFSIAHVQVINHQIIITGQNLDGVSEFKIKEGGVVTTTQIESQTSGRLVANTINNVTFAAGRVFDFILSNASAASTFNVNFSLCDSSLGGKGFDCITAPHDGDVLTYNNSTNKWEPKAQSSSGMNYKGTWNANDVSGFPTGSIAGDYYIVNVATVGMGSPHYNIGDWIVFNTNTGLFDHVANSSPKLEGDYSLTQLSDVDLSTPAPANGMVLMFNGTSWVPGTVSGGSGAVSSVNTQTGAVVLTTDNISEGSTNLYATNARTIASTITAPTLTNSAIATTDTIQVAFGKLQAQLNNVVSKTLTGLTAGSNTAISAADTLLVALANLQAQITNKADVTNGSQSITASTLTATTVNATNMSVANTPLAATDVVNKSYVDGLSGGDFKADGTVSMTGKFKAIQGAWNNPSISFASSTTTGLFDGGGYIGFSGGGSLLGSWSSSALSLNGTNSPYMRNVAGAGAATPGYAFGGSATTGMYFLSPSGIGFSNAGVESVRITSTGVGIGGVTTPAAKLDVAGEIKFGNTSSTCNTANEGQQRYNSSTKVMEFCNATAWTAFGTGGGGGGSGGLSACPSGYTLIAASSTHGTNAFCINTTLKADATLPAQMAACMVDSADLCKSRQLSAAMDALPAATLTEWTNVWTGDIGLGTVHTVVDASTTSILVYEARSGWRQIGQKGPPMIYGNFTPNIPATSPFGGYCCKQ